MFLLTYPTTLDDIPLAIVRTRVQAEAIAAAKTEGEAHEHVAKHRGDIGEVYGIDLWEVNDDGIVGEGCERLITWSE